MSEFVLDWNGFVIKISKKRIKNINLRLTRQGIALSAPIGLSIGKIKEFLWVKQSWIEKHAQRLQSEAPSTDHFFLGKPYALKIIPSDQKPKVTLDGSALYLWLPLSASDLDKKKLLHKWYATQMGIYLPDLIQKWEARIGVHAHQWRMRAMKSRWGSCNTLKKSICLNIYLIQRPLSCLEYVLVHELVHLLEPSHNQRFHALMDLYLPDWSARKLQLTLKDNQSGALTIL